MDVKREIVKIYANIPSVLPSLGQFTRSDDRICSSFGCRAKLTLTESMAGDKCTRCTGTKPLISDRNLSWIVKSK